MILKVELRTDPTESSKYGDTLASLEVNVSDGQGWEIYRSAVEAATAPNPALELIPRP